MIIVHTRFNETCPLSAPPLETSGDYASLPLSELFCTSSSDESRWYDGLLTDATITNTMPTTRSLPTMSLSTICLCGLERYKANAFRITARESWWRKVADMERILRRSWKVTVATVAPVGVKEGWRKVTLATVPKTVKTQWLVFFLRLKRGRWQKDFSHFRRKLKFHIFSCLKFYFKISKI